MDRFSYFYKKSTIYWLSFFLLVLIISIKGYQFGFSDHAEILPLALQLDNKELYPNDLYIQTITHIRPHERWLFCHFLVRIPGSLDLKFFFLYILFAYLWVLGTYKLYYYLSSSWLTSTVAILVLIGPLDGINTGGNELFYNFLVPSLVAKSISIWGWYFFVKDRPLFYFSYLLWALAGYAQPLVGTHCFILAFSIQGINYVLHKSWQWYFIIWVVLAGPWIITLMIANQSAGSVWDLLTIRDAHHYYPLAFPTSHLVILGGLSLLALSLLGWNKPLRYFILLVLFGCLVYSTGIWYENELILKTQWFKTTIWVEALGTLGLIMLGRRVVQNRIWLSIGCLSFCFILLFLKPFPPPYHFPWKKPQSDEIKIAIKAGELTPINSIFIVPFDFSAFRYYAQRSLYVDYKSVAHHGLYFQTWWPRIKSIYGLSAEQPGQMEYHRETGINYYGTMQENTIKKLPVDYMVTDTSHNLAFPRIASAGRYIIYQIR